MRRKIFPAFMGFCAVVAVLLAIIFMMLEGEPESAALWLAMAVLALWRRDRARSAGNG